MTGYTRFSDQTEFQSGHYLAVYSKGYDQSGAGFTNLSVNAAGGSSAVIPYKWAEDSMVEGLYTVVMRIDDNVEAIEITASFGESGETAVKRLNVASLILEPST